MRTNLVRILEKKRLLAEDHRAAPPHPRPLPVGARAIPGGPGRALARGTGLLHLAPLSLWERVPQDVGGEGKGEVGRRPGEGDLRLGPRFLDLSSVGFGEKSRTISFVSGHQMVRGVVIDMAQQRADH